MTFRAPTGAPCPIVKKSAQNRGSLSQRMVPLRRHRWRVGCLLAVDDGPYTTASSTIVAPYPDAIDGAHPQIQGGNDHQGSGRNSHLFRRGEPVFHGEDRNGHCGDDDTRSRALSYLQQWPHDDTHSGYPSCCTWIRNLPSHTPLLAMCFFFIVSSPHFATMPSTRFTGKCSHPSRLGGLHISFGSTFLGRSFRKHVIRDPLSEHGVCVVEGSSGRVISARNPPHHGGVMLSGKASCLGEECRANTVTPIVRIGKEIIEVYSYRTAGRPRKYAQVREPHCVALCVDCDNAIDGVTPREHPTPNAIDDHLIRSKFIEIPIAVVKALPCGLIAFRYWADNKVISQHNLDSISRFRRCKVCA